MFLFLETALPHVDNISIRTCRTSDTYAHFTLFYGRRTTVHYLSLFYLEEKNTIRLVYPRQLLFLSEKEKKGYANFIEKLIHVLVTYLESHPKFRLKMATGSFYVEYSHDIFQ